jgi:hypothetical protein
LIDHLSDVDLAILLSIGVLVALVIQVGKDRNK